MKNKLRRSMIAAGLCTLQLSACSSGPPPKQELQSTEKSIQIAIDSGAETKAPDELGSAQQKMQRALKLVKKKKYSDAKEVLHLARVDAQLAYQTAQAATARTEALQLTEEAGRLKRALSDRENRLSEQQRALSEQQQALDELKDLQAKQTDRGLVLTLGDVLFNTNESTLNDGARVRIDRIAAFMRKYPERTIVIEGHTDNTGDEDYNYGLSLDRATAVMTALLSRRIDPGRISTFGKGESVPLADNNVAAGRQQNRRVEIVFDKQDTIISDLNY